MTLILSARDVEPLCNMPEMVDIIERGLREEALGKAVVPPRMNLPSGDGFFRVMPAVMNDSGLMGYKVFHGSMKNGVRYLIAIYAREGERLLALMDAHYLTAARTGATTGIATKLLANPDAKTVAVIGSGLEARTNLQAVCAVRPVNSVTVFSPNPERRAIEKTGSAKPTQIWGYAAIPHANKSRNYGVPGPHAIRPTVEKNNRLAVTGTGFFVGNLEHVSADGSYDLRHATWSLLRS